MNIRAADPHWRQGLITQPLLSLTPLQLTFKDYRVDIDSELAAIEFLFQFLPNLRRVDLVLPEWPQVWSGYIFPSSVSVLGLRVCLVRPKRQAVKWLLYILNNVVQSALSPLKVQFLDGRTMQCVCMHEEYVVQNSEDEDILQSWLDPNGNVYELPI